MKIVKRGRAQIDADVMIIGAGLAGLTAAFDLVETGRKVLLVDRSAAHGGTMTLLDRQFPTDSCGFCQILPHDPQEAVACLKSTLSHQGVAFLPFTTVKDVKGKAGDFTATLNRKASGVDSSRCTRCGLCIEACPEIYPDPLHGGVIQRKAIGYREPLCAPSDLAVDWEHCTRCGACVKACPEEAVELDAKDWTEERRVGSIILATGFRLHDPSDIPEHGYGRLRGVLTTLELERLMAKCLSEGHEEILIPTHVGQTPRIAWIQCVGSRDLIHTYCSSVCCMISLKQARLLREMLPEAHLEIFYMDLRTCGKGYESYLKRANELGIQFTRGRPGEVMQRNGQLLLQVEGLDGTWREETVDMVVLSVGFEASPESRRLADLLGCALDPDGFLQASPGSLTRTDREGVYVAGAAAEPRDIPETVIQAHEAAAMAAVHSEPATLAEPLRPPPVTDPLEADLRFLAALCDCSETLAPSLDFKTLRAELAQVPNVVGCRLYSRLCHQEGIQQLSQDLKECEANGLIVGACTPRWLHPKLRLMFSAAGLDPNLVRIVNLREQGVWSHKNAHPGLIDRVRAELRAALAFCSEYRPLPQSPTEEDQSAILVVGGGPAGMCAALALSDLGIPVTMVEKEAVLGGNLRWIRYGLQTEVRPDSLLKDLLQGIKGASNIHVQTQTTVQSVRGRPGSYGVTLTDAFGRAVLRSFGAIILATGGHAYQPRAFHYGEDARILTQRDLELALSRKDFDPKALREVIMIQCVGSRDEEHPYCSRVCCAAALKNTLRLLEANPDLRLIVLYRDIRSFGTTERYYEKARELGALFIPFDPSNPPVLEIRDENLSIEADDPLVGLRVRFRPDRLILSTGIVPDIPAGLLSSLGLMADAEGFLAEANPKFRPLDLQDGVYACGLALGPAFFGEAMAQGRGAAIRAAAFLERLKRSTTHVGVRVHESRCSACGLCVTSCPFDARELDEEQGCAVVHSQLCQACGTCAAVCPNDATQLQGATKRQVLTAVDALFES